MTRTGGPEVFEVQDRPEPAVGARRGPDRGAGRRAQLRRHHGPGRPLSGRPQNPVRAGVRGGRRGGDRRGGGHRVQRRPAGDGGYAVRRSGGTGHGPGPGRVAAARPTELRAGRGLLRQLRHRVRRLDDHGRPAGARPGADPLRGRRGGHRRHPDRPQRRGGDLRHRIRGQARGHPGPGRAPSDRLPPSGFPGRGAPADRRGGRRRGAGRAGSDLVPQGLPDPPAGREVDHVRAVRGPERAGPEPSGHGAQPDPAPDLDHALVERRLGC